MRSSKSSIHHAKGGGFVEWGMGGLGGWKIGGRGINNTIDVIPEKRLRGTTTTEIRRERKKRP